MKVRKRTRQLSVTLASLIVFLGLAGLVQAFVPAHQQIAQSSETGFTSLSPRGEAGGAIVPASCEAGYSTHAADAPCDFSFVSDSYSVPYGGGTTIRWSNSNGFVYSCDRSGAWPDGAGASNPSGTRDTGSLTGSSYTYSLTCYFNHPYDAAGTSIEPVTKSVTVTVAPAPPTNACAPAADPAGYGSACSSAVNACGQTQSNGTIQCDGSCSSTVPANPAGYNSSCTSAGNACGQTQANGTIQCNGSCSSTPPPDANCPVAGNGSCGVTHYSCVAGASANNTDYPTAWAWTCLGVNGGSYANCMEYKVPDLSGGATAASPSDPSNRAYNFSGVVSNSGNGAAANFPNIFEVANMNSAQIAVLDAGTVASLASGASTGVAGSYTFSPTLGGETFYVRTCANFNTSWGGSISETSTANNCGAWTTLTIRYPDLVGGNTGVVTTTTSASFSAPISNSGSGAAVNFPNVFQVADSGLTATVAMVDGGSIALLGSGASAGISGSRALSPGSYNVRACGNYNTSWAGSISESDLTNNCGSWQPFSVVNTPTATLSASPTTIDKGQSATLSWNSTAATSCTGVGFTAGGTSGSRSTGALNTAGTQTYQVTCTGPGGTSAPAAASVLVLAPGATISATPARVTSGGQTSLSWSANGVQSCVVTGPSGTLASGASDANRAFTTGSPRTITVTGQSTYTITCQTNGSPVTKSITVNVQPDFQEF